MSQPLGQTKIEKEKLKYFVGMNSDEVKKKFLHDTLHVKLMVAINTFDIVMMYKRLAHFIISKCLTCGASAIRAAFES